MFTENAKTELEITFWLHSTYQGLCTEVNLPDIQPAIYKVL